MIESKTKAARQDENVLRPTDQLDHDSHASYCRPSQFKGTDVNRAALGSDSLDESGFKSMSTGFGVDMTEFTERSNPDSGIGVDSAHTSRAPYSRETWENEVLEFQKAKKQAVTNSSGYDTWRQHLRRRLQAELEQRVRKAVQTPPLERLHRRSQTRQEQATEAQTAQRQHKRQLVTKMNEMVGGTRSVHLVDGPPKPMFCNTVDLRLHPETHQWRKRWHRNSPPTIRQVEHLNGLILSSEDEIQNETRPRWTQQSLNRWLHRSRINNCDTASDVGEKCMPVVPN
ncbi:hypothetical protein FGIG_06011 [Fasciola gigantica]|uniref:Uncharacterized protein n=1 Tax=Fasciola gigantica TaxID=46835 RepID=A0A504ZD38_FASGI|nr:hypothetical protein FGIG_06011 [Fasciola gigantica]